MKRALVLVSTIAFAMGCGASTQTEPAPTPVHYTDFRAMGRDMQEDILLTNGIVHDFGNLGLTAARNPLDSSLTLTFQDSALVSQPDSVRGAFASRIAAYVRAHYAGYARIRRVNVRFTTSRYSFPGGAIGSPRDSAGVAH